MATLLAAGVWAACASSSAPSTRQSGPWRGTVTRVTDGDTLHLRDQSGADVVVRLHGVDAPERSQPFGAEARVFVTDRALGREVTVEPVATDRYGRTVARISIGGQRLDQLLVEQGYAWHYRRYNKSARLAVLEQAARQAHRGLWSSPHPTPPWKWRRAGHRSTSRSRSRSPATVATQPARQGPLHGNVRSKVFHTPGCPSYRCKYCQARFASASEAKAAGYRPHATCAGR